MLLQIISNQPDKVFPVNNDGTGVKSEKMSKKWGFEFSANLYVKQWMQTS